MSERKTTRFAVLEAERVVKVHEREIPALKADEVLIKMVPVIFVRQIMGSIQEQEKSDVCLWHGDMNLQEL